MTDRSYYAEIDEAQGYIEVERSSVRAGVSSMVGRYPLADSQDGCGPAFRMGRAPVVADTQTSPLIPDADRPAVAAVGGGGVRRRAADQGGQAGRGVDRERLRTAALNARRGRIRQGDCRADLGSHRTLARRRATAGSECPEGRIPGDARARTQESARPDPNRPRTDSTRRRYRGLDRAGARDDGASSRTHGALDRRPARRVENHVWQDCAATGAHTARGPGPQRGGGKSCRPRGQANPIEPRSAQGSLHDRCGSDAVCADLVQLASQRGKIHESWRVRAYQRERHGRDERRVTGVDFRRRFRHRDFTGAAASCVRLVHAGRDAFVGTWPGHRPRARAPAGRASRRTPRRPERRARSRERIRHPPAASDDPINFGDRDARG